MEDSALHLDLLPDLHKVVRVWEAVLLFGWYTLFTDSARARTLPKPATEERSYG